MDNLETLLEELERFEKKGGNGTSKILEEYIQHVAKTGDPLFPWHRIRYFMRFMLATVMNDFYENCGGEDVGECGNVPAFSYVPTREKILHHFDTFSGAPFTIQRLCEIMIDPTRHYKRTDKFLRGLEKNVLVVSTIEPGRQRRSEDPQQTLVNGLQDGGLHSSPISGSSRLSSPSHQSKRIASPQPTNSVNNANDFYDTELNASDSHVSGSEANGPNGIPLDERSIEAMAEIVEPLMKKRRMKVSPLEKALGPMAHLAHLQDKDSTYMSISEAESLEAEGSDEESNASSSSSSSAKTDEEAMETGEAEATTCHTESEDTKTTEETLCGHQVGTSEMTLQEAENPDEDSISKELKDEMPVPAEACSSDVMNATESEKSNDESNSVSLSSDSSGSGTNQGSPDSVEDNSEQAQPHPQKKEGCKGEKAGSSEAAAADLTQLMRLMMMYLKEPQLKRNQAKTVMRQTALHKPKVIISVVSRLPQGLDLPPPSPLVLHLQRHRPLQLLSPLQWPLSLPRLGRSHYVTDLGICFVPANGHHIHGNNEDSAEPNSAPSEDGVYYV
ncbi:serine/threonine-protein phosphatase 4 regulatory subunit 2-like [Macrobrachium nipponense]|uniref:serine/threonine-protein phosphatase 4 regulatory subunit 2-like n=1 Tax=Macrobrachium nipponense TaxID=159736 RepID=UPI0030C7F5B6